MILSRKREAPIILGLETRPTLFVYHAYMRTYIIGLGNPGETYTHTRHNVGFMIADAVAQKAELMWKHDSKFKAEVAQDMGKGIFLIKPQAFMNKSGEAVGGIVRYFDKEELAKTDAPNLQSGNVCYDDLDIPFGQYKIQFGKHPKIHHGVNSIIQALGTDQFWNVRIGTESRFNDAQNMDQASEKIPGETYVLTPFTKEERDVLAPMIERVVQEIYAKAFPSQSSR